MWLKPKRQSKKYWLVEYSPNYFVAMPMKIETQENVGFVLSAIIESYAHL